MKKLFTLLIVIVAMYSHAQQTITMKSGQSINGQITDINDVNITVQTDSIGVVKLLIENIENIDYHKNDNATTTVLLNKNSAGDELIKASNIYYAGIGVTAAGIIAFTIADQLYKVNPSDSQKIQDWNLHASNTMKVIGVAVMGVGTIMQIAAFSHIGKAGRKLNATVNGNGLVLSLNF